MAKVRKNGADHAASTDRLPPHSIEAEMSLLGSLLLNRDAVGEVLEVINPEDSRWFYRPDHQTLFHLLVELYDAREPIDLVTVREALLRKERLEEIGGVDYLVKLAESVPTWVNAPHYAKIVRDKGILRDLIRCCDTITASAFAHVDESQEILDRAEQALFDVTEKRISGHPTTIRNDIQAASHSIESREEAFYNGLETGFTALDELTGGFQPGDFIVIAGRPSMGKTAFSLGIAENIAAGPGARPIIFFSMEMSRAQVVQRILCSRARVDAHLYRKRLLGDERIRALMDACDELQDAPLFVDDTPNMTVMELRAKARRLRQQHKIEAVFVDYLQLMHQPRAESRQQEIATISRGLKALGRELNIPIVAMAQLNRQTEGREGHRPRMSDLRESGAIEQDADVVILLHREEYYKPDDPGLKGLAEAIVAKQRNGPTDVVKLQFDRKITRFNNLAYLPEPQHTPTYGAVRSESSVPF